MNNKLNLIIINPTQFGYHTGTYYCCKYLSDIYELVYICWDQSLKKIEMPGVRIKYVSRNDNALLRSFRFINYIHSNIGSNDTILFIKNFKLLNTVFRLLFYSNPAVLDIRTGSIEQKLIKRLFFDAVLRFECLFYKNITIISRSLSKKLYLSRKAYILPLGADIISNTNKRFDSLNLLYVGTLLNRNINSALQGFSKFHKEFHNQISTKFTIIGTGPNEEESSLNLLAKNEQKTDFVSVLGRIPHNELRKYFDNHNVGVSYIPITDFYNAQPPLKTFEYLLSGMPVIATATHENSLVIDRTNGVLTGDKPDDFYTGLVKIFERRGSYNSQRIREMSKKYNWSKIYHDFKKYLETIQPR